MSHPHPNQIALPPDLGTTTRCLERARIWESDQGEFFLLNVTDQDPAAWGIWAVDFMKHAARAYEQLDGRSREVAYKQMLAGFMAEMQSPTEPL